MPNLRFMGGEHATSIDGEGRNPTDTHILSVASKAGLDSREAKKIMSEVKNAVQGIGIITAGVGRTVCPM